MSINFINITEDEFLEKPLLYKYMPLEFALSTIDDHFLWFCNPSIWKDPFERKFINGKYIVDGKEVEFPIKNQVFCMCMTQTIACEAHWKAYSNAQIGICFKYKRKQLLNILKRYTTEYDIYIGKVNYVTTKYINKKLSEIPLVKTLRPFELRNRELQIQLLLLKRIAFSYEDEIRVLAVKKHKTKESGIRVHYFINPTKLIDTITIDPNVQSHTEKMLKNLFKEKYKFEKVYKSQIYSMSTTKKEIEL